MRAGNIVTNLMTSILDPQDKEQLANYMRTNESMNQAIESLDGEWGKYPTLDVAAIHDIIKENYPQTLEHVEENHIKPSQYTKVEQLYRDMVLHCMAYDIAKTVDHKIENIIEEDSEVVKV